MINPASGRDPCQRRDDKQTMINKKSIKQYIFLLGIGFLVMPSFAFAQLDPTDPMFDPSRAEPVEQPYVIGEVIDVFHESETDEYGVLVFVQELHVQLLNGEEQGREVSVLYEVQIGQENTQKLHKGDKVFLSTYPYEDPPSYFISDVYRLDALGFIFVLFVVLAVFFARGRAIGALVGLALSFGVIGWYILPRILAGDNPVMVSLIGAALIASVSLYLAHGFRVRTTIAFIGTILTAGIAIVLASLFVRSASLFGIGSEEAFYLQFAGDTTINLQGLLLGGIIIGMMGVLDDITTAQAATVEEIHKANPALDTKELYARGSSVGREHITSLINTLVLAYTGAALPLLLLFRVYETPFLVTLNGEIVMEELIRMLAGSMALILAVPITTWLAARWFGRHPQKEEA